MLAWYLVDTKRTMRQHKAVREAQWIGENGWTLLMLKSENGTNEFNTREQIYIAR
jgi:hypothetical protein